MVLPAFLVFGSEKLKHISRENAKELKSYFIKNILGSFASAYFDLYFIISILLNCSICVYHTQKGKNKVSLSFDFYKIFLLSEKRNSKVI